jgi:hypothetical protein
MLVTLCHICTIVRNNKQDWQCTYKRNIEARSCNQCYSGKEIHITYSELRVCSLRYQACYAHAQYCHLCPAPLYNIFPHYLINGTIFEKKKLLNTKCVFRVSLQLLSEKFFILRGTERDVI